MELTRQDTTMVFPGCRVRLAVQAHHIHKYTHHRQNAMFRQSNLIPRSPPCSASGSGMRTTPHHLAALQFVLLVQQAGSTMFVHRCSMLLARDRQRRRARSRCAPSLSNRSPGQRHISKPNQYDSLHFHVNHPPLQMLWTTPIARRLLIAAAVASTAPRSAISTDVGACLHGG